MSNKEQNQPLQQPLVSGSVFGGLDKYFEDLEEYEQNLYCSECGEDGKKFNYIRTTSNAEVWWCHNCKKEQVVSKRPNEDKY